MYIYKYICNVIYMYNIICIYKYIYNAEINDKEYHFFGTQSFMLLAQQPSAQ